MSPRRRRPGFAHRFNVMPEIISRIRWHRGMLRDELDNAITKELFAILSGQRSEKKFPPKAKVKRRESHELSSDARSKLDAIILRQAETLGWRLLLSGLVLQRIDQWGGEENGPELFETLGKALAKSVRILQRKALPPIDNPDLIATQDQTIRELRIVRHEMRKVFSKKRRSPSDRAVLQCFTTVVSDSGKSCFALLRANLIQWQLFLEKNPTTLRVFALGKRGSPAALFREWLSWCKGHTPETLRKKISGLRSALTKQITTP